MSSPAEQDAFLSRIDRLGFTRVWKGGRWLVPADEVFPEIDRIEQQASDSRKALRLSLVGKGAFSEDMVETAQRLLRHVKGMRDQKNAEFVRKDLRACAVMDAETLAEMILEAAHE